MEILQTAGIVFVAIGELLVKYAPDLVGFIMPPIVEFLNKDIITSRERFIVSTLVAVLAATLLKWGSLTAGSVDQVLVSASIIFAESQLVFKLYFKDSWVRTKLNEKLTAGQI